MSSSMPISKSIVELLSNAHPMKSRLSATILILSIFTFIFLLVSSMVKIMDLLTIHERVLINAVVLILSILLFIAIFWKETMGDFFSFINIVLCLYFPLFVIPIFAILFIPEASISKSNYWGMSHFEYAVWIVIFTLYSLCFGYKLAQKIGGNIRLPFGAEPSVKRIISYVFISIIALLAIAFIKSYLMQTNLLETIWFKSYGSELVKREDGIRGYNTVLIFFQYFFSYIFFTCFMLPRDNPKNKALIRCANIFILLYIAYTITNGIITTSKSGPIFIVSFLFIFLLFSMFILITFTSLRIPQASTLSFSNIVYYMESFESFERLGMIISHFSNNAYYFGQRLFEEIFLLLIPRALWEGKPLVYGARVALYDINPDFFFSGYAVGLHGQFYSDFGLPGVIIGFAVFGALIRIVYNIFRNISLILFVISLPFHAIEWDLFSISRFEIKVTMITFMLLVVAWFLRFIKFERKRCLKEKLFYSFAFIYGISQFASLLNSPMPEESLKQAVIISCLLIMMVIVSESVLNKETVISLLIIMGIVSLVIGIWGFVYYVFFTEHSSRLGNNNGDLGIIYIGGDAPYFGDLLLYSIGPVFYVILNFFDKKSWAWVKWFLLILWFSAIILTYTKAMIVSVVLFLIYLLFIFKKQRLFIGKNLLLFIVATIFISNQSDIEKYAMKNIKTYSQLTNIKDTSIKDTSIKDTSIKDTSIKDTSIKDTSIKYIFSSW